MLLALKLLVVLGVLSYALAAVLGERELVVYGHATAATAKAAFQPPLSHFVRAPRHHVGASGGQGPGHGHGHGQGHGGQQEQGELSFLGRRVSLLFVGGSLWGMCV